MSNLQENVAACFRSEDASEPEKYAKTFVSFKHTVLQKADILFGKHV